MEKDKLIQSLQTQVEVLKKDFQVEMNAKNEAYGFIAANGLLQKFREFHYLYLGEDHHLNTLMSMAK